MSPEFSVPTLIYGIETPFSFVALLLVTTGHTVGASERAPFLRCMWRPGTIIRQDACRVRRPSRHPLVFVRTVSGYTLASMSGMETTILIADDEPIVLSLAATALESAGYRILKARNGREALEACQRHQGRIDLGLLDYFMPRMT